MPTQHQAVHANRTATPAAPPKPAIAQIAAAANDAGRDVLYALMSDGSLWRLENLPPARVFQWVQIDGPLDQRDPFAA